MNILKHENSTKISFNNISKITILNSKEIEKQLIEIINKENCTIILDLSNIEFIDSSGFYMLLNIYKITKLNNLTVELKNISTELTELFNTIKLNHLFDIN